MGFITGFTGGVTLTLGVAYLTLLSHQRTREHQAAVLRQQTYLLSGVVDPLPSVLPPTRAELAALERAHFAEAAKDRWNAEVEHAVRWAQTKDWTEVREGVETAVGRLWARALGRAVDGAEHIEAKAKTDGAGVAAAAKSAYADAKSRVVGPAETKVEEKVEEARGSVLSAIGKGIEKGKGLFSSTKSVVEDKVGAAAAAASSSTSSLSPVEQALQERYKGSAAESKQLQQQTVDEILAARYAPIDPQAKSTVKTL